MTEHRHPILLLALLLLVPASFASSEEGVEAVSSRDPLEAVAEDRVEPGAASPREASEPAEAAVPDVALDDLLGLPRSYETEQQRRGGATEAQWRARYSAARQVLDESREKLAETEAALDDASQNSAAWQVAAPGSSDPQTSPLSLKLRAEVRAYRDAIAVAERDLRALDVQADLASVPPEWREGRP